MFKIKVKCLYCGKIFKLEKWQLPDDYKQRTGDYDFICNSCFEAHKDKYTVVNDG